MREGAAEDTSSTDLLTFFQIEYILLWIKLPDLKLFKEVMEMMVSFHRRSVLGCHQPKRTTQKKSKKGKNGNSGKMKAKKIEEKKDLDLLMLQIRGKVVI